MNDYIVLISEDGQPYISHHGIKGQKWGVRRYQNPDGSLTAEGLRRYGTSATGNMHRALSKVYDLNARTYDRLGNKTLASMNRAAQKQQLEKANASDARKLQKKKDALNAKGTKALAKTERREIKASARAELKGKLNDINKRREQIDKKYDLEKFKIEQNTNYFNKRQQEAKHVRNEYKREQAHNKLHQEELNSLREYRTKIGKKHTNTLLMTYSQSRINSIRNKSELEFGMEYAASQARLEAQYSSLWDDED